VSKRKKKTQSHSKTSESHIRLCHVCFYLSESEQPIVQCQDCDRYLTIEPLVDEHLNNRGEDDDEGKGHHLSGGLQGLAVVW